MELEEIRFELELTGMSLGQISKVIASVKRDGFDAKLLDKKLIGMGFAPVFTIYDDL